MRNIVKGVSNVKLNRATNSSSTHSIIMTGKAFRDRFPFGNEYGLEEFVLGSEEAKKDYLATMLYQNLSLKMDRELALTAANSYMGTDIEGDSYVDHQSFIYFPLNWKGNPLNMQFFDDFCAAVLQDGVTIFGGNDNSEADSLGDLLSEECPCIELPRFYDDETVARKDGDHWTLFNRETGKRATFSFVTEDKLEIADSPMLVEINVTDKCERGCPWCYRNATPDGEAAPREKVTNLAYHLREAGVFEVCFGGGEPVEHPKFHEILEIYNYYHINTNFTTRSLKWPVELQRAVVKCNTGVGFSVDTYEEAKEAVSVFSDWGILKQVTLHIVDRLFPIGEFEILRKFARDAGVQLLVLGYKNIGRGAGYQEKGPSLWPLLKKGVADHWPIAVDTIFAAEYQEELRKLKVPAWLYQVKEGNFNCFVDAVRGYIARSSYDYEENVPLTDSPSDFKKVWESLPRDGKE